MANYTLNVNGKTHTVDVDGAMPLLWVLRDKIDLKGTKFGCGVASCGARTLHLGGKLARDCMTPGPSVAQRESQRWASSAGTAGLVKKPCISVQPHSRRRSRCSAVSTPAAATSTPR